MRTIRKIVVHCSDSDRPEHDNIETIREWHTQRGFTGPDGVEGTHDDVGYHYVITQDGKKFVGRKEWEIGAHVRGHNSDSIAVCLTGGRKTVASPAQRETLGPLLKDLCARYNLKKLDIVAHRDLDPGKECPIFDLEAFLASLHWH
jgi:N-acetylmuramoyl-L-alanine amidase